MFRDCPLVPEVKKNSKAVADAGESCLTTEKGLYSSLSLSDNAYSDRSRAYFQPSASKVHSLSLYPWLQGNHNVYGIIGN